MTELPAAAIRRISLDIDLTDADVPIVTRKRGSENVDLRPLRASLDLVRDQLDVWQVSTIVVRGKRTDVDRAPLARMGYLPTTLPEWLNKIVAPRLRVIRATDGLA